MKKLNQSLCPPGRPLGGSVTVLPFLSA